MRRAEVTGRALSVAFMTGAETSLSRMATGTELRRGRIGEIERMLSVTIGAYGARCVMRIRRVGIIVAVDACPRDLRGRRGMRLVTSDAHALCGMVGRYLGVTAQTGVVAHPSNGVGSVAARAIRVRDHFLVAEHGLVPMAASALRRRGSRELMAAVAAGTGTMSGAEGRAGRHLRCVGAMAAHA